MTNEAALLTWWAIGLIGGIVLNRNERIDPFAWPMTALFGPLALALGIWEYIARRKGQ